jgi:ABC-type phosphate/phosphonate transport system substrate-binding protein
MILLAAALAAAPAAPLRIATYAYPAYDRRQALAPLARLITEETGRPVEVILFPSPDELSAALRARRVDVAMTNLASFIAASRERRVRPIAALSVPPATLDGYRGVLLARQDAGIGSLDELRAAAGRLRYAEVLPGSTSGALVQADALRRAGGDPRGFASIEQAGTHDAALERLLSGRSDVAALAEGPWRTLQAAHPEQAATLVQLWRSDPLPPGPVVCVEAASVPCSRIARRLLRGDGASRDAAAGLARGWSETAGAHAFVRVRESAYRPFIGPDRR